MQGNSIVCEGLRRFQGVATHTHTHTHGHLFYILAVTLRRQSSTQYHSDHRHGNIKDSPGAGLQFLPVAAAAITVANGRITAHCGETIVQRLLERSKEREQMLSAHSL